MRVVNRSMNASECADAVHGAAGSTQGTDDETGDGGSEFGRLVRHLGTHRLLLLMHCYAEGILGSVGRPSACVGYVLRREGLAGRYRVGQLPSHSDLNVMLKTIDCHREFVEKVDMEDWYTGDDGLKQFLPVLFRCPCLKVFNLNGNHLSDVHMAAIGDILAQNRQTLEEVDLGWNEGVGDQGVRRVANGLQPVQGLKRLRLQGLELTHRSGCVIADVISEQPALIECNLGSNHIGDLAFATIGSALQKCKYLEELHLFATGLTSKSMDLLASVIAGLLHLKVLDVGYSQIGENGFEMLEPGLRQSPRLRALYLGYCGLTCHGVRLLSLLTSTLLALPQLERLSLSGNQIGDAGLEQLSTALEKCHRLTELWLCDIGMTSSQSMSVVCHLLHRLKQLRSLHIDCNPYGGDSTDVQLWAAVGGHVSLENIICAARPGPRSHQSVEAAPGRRRMHPEELQCALNGFNDGR